MEFLTQAISLAENIHNMTRDLILTGKPESVEQDVNNFADLMEKREPMVAKLTQLIKQDTSEDKAARQKLDSIIKKIVELDKEYSAIMKGVRETVTAALKGARGGRKLSQAYSYPVDELLVGVLDTKQ